MESLTSSIDKTHRCPLALALLVLIPFLSYLCNKHSLYFAQFINPTPATLTPRGLYEFDAKKDTQDANAHINR